MAFADRILINKVSLVEAEQLEELRRAIKSINATAACYETNYSKWVLECWPGKDIHYEWVLTHSPHHRIGLDKVLGINAFDPVKGVEMVATQSQTPHLDGSVTTVTFNVPGSVDREAVEAWLQDLLWEKKIGGKQMVSSHNWPWRVRGSHSCPRLFLMSMYRPVLIRTTWSFSG